MTYEEAEKAFEEHMEASQACLNCGALQNRFHQIYALDIIMVREEWNNYIDMLVSDGDITRDEAEDWGNPY